MQRLESVLDETQREFSQLHLAVKPRFEEIRQRMRLGIRQILNEEQKREYDVMIRDATSKGQEERRMAPVSVPPLNIPNLLLVR